jgi:hypothetical protein
MLPQPKATRQAGARALAVSLLLFVAAAHAGTGAAPWWSAFADPVLDTVMQAAAPATADAEQAVVDSYIDARLGQVRTLLATQLVGAASHQQAVLMNAPIDEQRQAGLAALARRIESFENTAAAINHERDKTVAVLVQRTGLAPARLQGLLAPVNEQAILPGVKAPVPQTGSVSVLRNDLAQRLQVLGEQTHRVSQLEQLVGSRKLELQAHQTREQIGAENELGALEAYQQFVVDSDQLAQATGRLAVAWAQWLQGSGVRTVAAAR